MEFQIELEDGRRLTYNTDPCSLTWDDGTRVDLSKFAYRYVDPPEFQKQITFSPDNPVIGKDTPRVLKIQLGLGCNYSCSYCSQGGQKEEASSIRDAEEFDFSWVPDRPEKVELWGGEPLLYWKKIQALVPKIRAAFGDVRISLVTNGTLLTREKVDWLFNTGFSIAISHDGPAQFLRGEDPLKDPELLAVWRYTFEKFGERACINSVITEHNCDLLQLWMWFEERLGTVKLNVEDVVTDYGGGKLSDAGIKKIYESIKTYASSGLVLVFPRLRFSFQQFLETLAISKPLDGANQVCQMDRKDYLAVDLHGNVLTCQNTGAIEHRIGTIDNLQSVKLDTATSYTNRPHCHECLVVHLCYGSCMFLNGDEFKASCRASYWYNRALIEGCIYLLTGCKIKAISGWSPAFAKRVIPIKVAA